MGYSHYITSTRTLTDSEWAIFTEQAKRIFAAAPCQLADGSGEAGTAPVVTPEMVSFNGLDEESYETCAIHRSYAGFECCKVSNRPYDPVVGAVYLAFQAVHGGTIVTSDGNMEGDDWAAARSLFGSTRGEPGADADRAHALRIDPKNLREMADGADEGGNPATATVLRRTADYIEELEAEIKRWEMSAR